MQRGAFGRYKANGLLQCLQYGEVQVFCREFAKLCDAREIPAWLDHVREIDDFFQKRHISFSRGMPSNGLRYSFPLPEKPCRHGGTGQGVKGFVILVVEIVYNNTIFFT